VHDHGSVYLYNKNQKNKMETKMDLQHVAMTDFVLLQSSWPVTQSRQLIDHLKPSHVIVHHREAPNAYYLLNAREALHLLRHAKNSSSLNEAFHLQDRPATPAVEGSTDADSAPDQCIVLADGRPAGFFDATVPPQQVISVKRGGEGFVPNKPELVSRSLVVEAPERVQVETVFSLLVSLSSSSTPEKGAALPIALPLGTTVDILVQPRRGFALVEGNGECTLTVSSDEETLPLQFKLRGVGVGSGQIRVLAFHCGQALGEIKLTVTVIEALANPETQRHGQEQILQPIRSRQPDLHIWIEQLIGQATPTFLIRLTAQDPALELNLKPFGPFSLKMDPARYFQEFFADIEHLSLHSSRDRAIAQQRLAARGSTLFESVLPEDLQLLLWRFRERIQSVQVQSEEPWIPWELCKLSGKGEDGRVVEGPFFCEAFAITRWIPPTPFKHNLKLKNMAVVVPPDSGLAFAKEERDYLLSLRGDSRQVTTAPTTSIELIDALACGIYDGWHFSGHGRADETDPNNSPLLLENQEILLPAQISGKVKNLGLARPLVFLNACQIGRSGMSLTGIGGWANQFLQAGASAFIGSYWSIDDTSAFDFAREFYNRLLSGVPIGRAAQEARLAIKSAGDLTWLAYTVFAHPLADIVEDISL
jgi:hypothetical protein